MNGPKFKLITGGQAGVDQGAWAAARSLGIRTGGAMPLGYLTEAGPRPEFAALYGAHPSPSPDYSPRTRENVRSADLTLLFNVSTEPGVWSGGTHLAVAAARQHGKPWMLVGLARSAESDPFEVRLIQYGQPKVQDIVLNVFGEPLDTSADQFPRGTPSMAGGTIRDLIDNIGPAVLNVGGNRESRQRGVQAWTERFLRLSVLGVAR